MGAHQTRPVNIEQMCSFGARRYGDYIGCVEESWIKWLGWRSAVTGTTGGARVKKRKRWGMIQRDICSLFLEPCPAHRVETWQFWVTRAVTTAAWRRRRMEGGGKIGRLIEIITAGTRVTVVIWAAQRLNQARRRWRASSNHEWAKLPAQALQNGIPGLFSKRIIYLFERRAPKCFFSFLSYFGLDRYTLTSLRTQRWFLLPLVNRSFFAADILQGFRLVLRIAFIHVFTPLVFV